MTKKVKLTIEFDSAAARKHFASWLCGSGEQEYWEWMRCREEEDDGPITAVGFDYHEKVPGPRGGRARDAFIPHGRIRTTCGRLDADDEETPDVR